VRDIAWWFKHKNPDRDKAMIYFIVSTFTSGVASIVLVSYAGWLTLTITLVGLAMVISLVTGDWAGAIIMALTALICFYLGVYSALYPQGAAALIMVAVFVYRRKITSSLQARKASVLKALNS
jgi:uncharacterized membrane protein YfcA